MSIFAPKSVPFKQPIENNNLYSATSSAMIYFGGAAYDDIGQCISNKDHKLQFVNSNSGNINYKCLDCNKACTMSLGSRKNLLHGGSKSSDPFKLRDEINQLLADITVTATENKRPTQQEVIDALEAQEGGDYKSNNSRNNRNSNQKKYKRSQSTESPFESEHQSTNQYDREQSRSKEEEQSSWTETQGQGRWYGGQYNRSIETNASNQSHFMTYDKSLSRTHRNGYNKNGRNGSNKRNGSQSRTKRNGSQSRTQRNGSNSNRRNASQSRTLRNGSNKNGKNSSQTRTKRNGSNRSTQKRDPGAPDPLAKYREYVAFIRDDMGLKGGPLTNSFAAYFRDLAKKQNPAASQDELNEAAKRIYNEEKKAGRLNEIFNKVKENLERKRQAKKEQKEISKQNMLSSTSSDVV